MVDLGLESYSPFNFGKYWMESCEVTDSGQGVRRDASGIQFEAGDFLLFGFYDCFGSCGFVKV